MDILTRTSIDLELDLAAQQSKLVVLSEEIDRLRQIKKQMEEAKGKGDKELPLWLQQDDKFQHLLTSVKMNYSKLRVPQIPNFDNLVGGKVCPEKL